MIVCETKAAVRDAVRDLRADGGAVGFVPTMGALHGGHLELVRRAAAENAHAVVSIFVNPTQFGPNEDFDTYPRDTEADLKLLREAGVDAVFLPQVAEIYPEGAQTFVDTEVFSKILVGKLRPGHFRGVATVVTKLFNIVAPDRAYFGRKDYQQLQMIRRMVADLDAPVEIVGVPTAREADGLAMSSRNLMLTPEDRAAAAVLNRSLDRAEELGHGAGVTAGDIAAQVREVLAGEPRGDVRSVDVVDAETLGELEGPLQRPAVVLLSVKFGDVLLIDQRVVGPEGRP